MCVAEIIGAGECGILFSGQSELFFIKLQETEINRNLLRFWLVLTAFAQAAGLEFDVTHKELSPAADAETAAAEISFCKK